jgi:uncharacterized protein YbcC (UPF0753/DUF2309 family)
MQSVHDGERFIHEPLRLNAVIEAPESAMSAIIAKNEGLRQLVDNGWVHLWRMDETGRIAARYVGQGRWEAISSEPLAAAA